MIIDAVFAYQAEVIGKGKRNSCIENFHETARLELREIEEEDAPIAVRWNDVLPPELEEQGSFHEKTDWGYYPESGFCHTRWFDDSHWWEVILKSAKSTVPEDACHPRSDHYGPRPVADADDLRRSLSYPHSRNDDIRRQLGLDVRLHGTQDMAQPLIEENYRRVISHNRTACRDALMEKIDDLAIIGGKLYRRGPEPALTIHTWVRTSEDLQGIVRVAPLPEATKRHSKWFRADRWNDAQELALSVYADQPSINDARIPEIRLLESLRFDQDVWDLDSCARRLYTKLSTTNIGALSRSAGETFFHLRDALSMEKGTIREERVVESLRLLAAAEHLDGEIIRMAEQAVENWDLRPIDDLNPFQP